MKYRPNIGKDIKREHAQLLCLKQRWARKKGETETMNGVSNKLIFISYCQSVLRNLQHKPHVLQPYPVLTESDTGELLFEQIVCVYLCSVVSKSL